MRQNIKQVNDNWSFASTGILYENFNTAVWRKSRNINRAHDVCAFMRIFTCMDRYVYTLMNRL